MKTISTVNVKKRMAELEISTQKELAEACGFSLSTARRVLGGLAKPEQSTVKLLAEGLKTTQGNILGEIQESAPPMDLSKEIYIPIRGKVWATPFRISMQRDYGVIRGLPGEQNCYALQVEGRCIATDCCEVGGEQYSGDCGALRKSGDAGRIESRAQCRFFPDSGQKTGQ